jgi:uncharacterized protein (TIGR02996 family)
MNTEHALSLPKARAFHRAICENPDDDTPRMIYADWLDENGFPGQAEFIRLDVELCDRGLPVRYYAPYEEIADTDRALIARRGELICRELLWPFGSLLERFHKTDLRRGFLHSVKLPVKDFLANAKALFSVQPIREVVLMIATGVNPRITRISSIGEFGSVLYNADLTTGRNREKRIPGPIFAFLDRVGIPVQINGARAEIVHGRKCVYSLVSRAAVAFGRHEAGLPPLAWPAWDAGPK